MPSKISITIVQMKPKLGNIEFNVAKILEYYNKAHTQIVLFPELSLTGYSPRDQLLSSKFIENCHTKVNEILCQTSEKICIVGTPFFENGKLYNAVLAMQHGKIIAKSFKTHLPNYEVFEEMRYFSSGSPAFFTHNGVKFGLPICEDIWHEDVCQSLKMQGVNIFLVVNASPFHIGKREYRLAVAQKRFNETQIPIIYCNQVVCQDGILFDGSSFCYDGGEVYTWDAFEECDAVVHFYDGKFTQVNCNSQKIYCDNEILHKALIFGLREYVHNAGFSKVIIGISGGADSALVAYLAVQAFGSKNVIGVFMPSQFTSIASIQDAQSLAQNLKFGLRIVSIERPLAAFHDILNISGLSEENIQARIRGNILMSISNSENAMVLTTGNKSEIATGYCTIYGDMCGGYNPIKDLYKTQVFAMMKFVNELNFDKLNAIIPTNIITKEPSAELRFDQKDSDSLPPYPILDDILHQIIEQCKQVDEITQHSKEIVTKVCNLVKFSEYKRQQSALGTKLSTLSLNLIEWKRNT